MNPPAEKSFLTSDGVRLTYLTSGSGHIDLIMIPGWLMPADVFLPQFEFFSDRYRVHAMNPRSQGSSDIYTGPNLAQLRARDIKDFIEHLGTRKFVLIGWSLGVMETLDAISRHEQDGLLAVVLVDNSIGEGTPPTPGRQTANPRKEMSPAQFRQYMSEFIPGMFRKKTDSALLESINQSAMRLSQSPKVAFRILNKPYPRTYYRETVYALKCPVFYAVTPRFEQQASLLAKQHPLAWTKIYRDAGHALFIDAADEFNTDLNHFLISRVEVLKRDER